MIPAIGEFEHPWLVVALLFGVGLMAIAVLLHIVGITSKAGYFGLFSVVVIILVAVGYGGVFSLKFMARV